MTIVPTPGYVGPTSMFGTDLTLTRLPDWVRLATLHRTARMERPSWHTLYRMALDVSDLLATPCHTARVLVDWHGNGATSVIAQARDIGQRTKHGRQATSEALTYLVESGWLSRVQQAGRGSILTLLVPLGVSSTATPHLSSTATPLSSTATPPVVDNDTIRGIGAEEHSQEHGAFIRERGPARVPVTVSIDHIDPSTRWEDVT